MTTYVVEYCYCAIAFLLVIILNSCTARQFPSLANRVFRVEMYSALTYVMVDVVGAYTIPLARTLPFWINHVLNTTFYVLQLAFPALLLLYVLALGRFRLRTVPMWIFVPVLAAELIVLTNPLHGLMFSIDSALGYRRGPFFGWMFGCCILYIALTFVVLNLYRKRMNRKQYWTIFLFILLVVGAATIQFFRPNILLSSPAIAISIAMLYLTIQKPDDMLDVTTGVFNRTAMMQMVEDYVIEKKAFQATVIVFKQMSRLDRIMGFDILNRLMTDIGQFLAEAYPHSWVFRLSGASLFVVLTRKRADYDTGLERARRRIHKPWLADEYDITLPISILCMPHGEIVRSADEFARLISYTADRAAEESDTVLGEAALDEVNRRSFVENALTVALAEDMLDVYLQPIFHVREKSFSHAEALVRLNWHGEMISPAEFIPIAEQNGLILRIDALVLRKVCAFLRANDARDDFALRSVGVNLSAVELMRPTIADDLRKTLEEYGIAPERITFEMTETAASGPFAETQKRIECLRAEGFRFALDDFGTGFANITQVVQLPFDIAKLDRSILTSNANSASFSILHTCIQMFKALGIDIVAEGAESAADVARLMQLDVDFIQGYYFARPMPLGQAKAFFEHPRVPECLPQ